MKRKNDQNKIQLFFKMEFNPRKSDPPLQGKKGSTQRVKHTGNLLRKNLQIKGVS